MTCDPVQPRSRADFLRLANICGMSLTAADLFQLNRRKFLCPLEESSGVEELYCSLHLYMLAIYFEGVRHFRHPWASTAPERTLDEVGSMCRELGEFVERLRGKRETPVSGEEVATLAMEMERYLHGIDPFGPLAGIIDIMRADVVEKLRGAGRLYAELRLTGAALAEMVERIESGAEVSVERPAALTEPKTQAIVVADEPIEDLRRTQLIERSEASEVIVAYEASATVEGMEPVDAVAVAKEEDEDLRRTQVMDTLMSLPSVIESEAEPGIAEESSTPMDLIDEQADDEPQTAEVTGLPEAAADDVSADAVPVAAADHGAHGFGRDDSRTSRNEDLSNHLERLRVEDRQGAPPEAPQKVKQAAPVEGRKLADRIAELNRQREKYLKEQAWEKLVHLYEEGIDLFSDGAERQQVYLVLATLYEMKLREKARALDAFIRAFAELGSEASMEKELDGIERLGRLPEVNEGYLATLESELAGSLGVGERRKLQRHFAIALYGAGQYQRAFLFYASMLAENPDENIDPQSLGDLELLGSEVKAEELVSFYHDILEQNVRTDVRSWVQQRVEASAV
ncbi:MAG: hypothetical protein H0U74_12995 [Bradymonadaceae bacterium]|nr:hypothetical protein [Lujinxingiaceae bacterium]